MASKSALTKAREAAGLTVEKISEQTNIRVQVIEDLEKNSTQACGGIAYARGHIKLIAKAIKADANPFIKEIESAQSSESKKIFDLLYENSIAKKPKEKTSIKFKSLATLSISCLALFFVAQIAINNVQNLNSSVSNVSGNESKVNSDQPIAKNIFGVNLMISGVKGVSWVGLVNSSGQQIFNGQILEGQSEIFSDSTFIKAVIGNAGAVKIELNGSDLGLAGSDGQVVRYDFNQNGATQQ